MSATAHTQNVDDDETSGPAEGRNVRDLASERLAPVGRRTAAPRDHPAADNADPDPATKGGETRRAGDHAPARLAPRRRAQPDNSRPGLLTRVVSALGTWLVSSAGELEERALEQSLRHVVASSRMNVVTVAGQRGGVGKTSLAVCVGGLLADVARLNVVALDADLDYGPLADHVPDSHRSDKTIVDLLNDFAGDQAVALPRLRPYLSRMPSGLLVLAAPHRREEMRELTSSDLDRALALLSNFDVCLLDCAAGVERDLAPWATTRADRLIIVTTGEYVGARNVCRAISELPLEQAILAINKIPTSAGRRDHAVERDLFSELLDQRFLVGYDEQLHRMLDQGRLDLARLRRATRLDLKQFAAAIAQGLR